MDKCGLQHFLQGGVNIHYTSSSNAKEKTDIALIVPPSYNYKQKLLVHLQTSP